MSSLFSLPLPPPDPNAKKLYDGARRADDPRRVDLGAIPGLPAQFSTEEHLRLFRQTCFNRLFEMKVFEAFKAKKISVPIYLSVGHEHIPVALSMSLPKPMIFAQHRAHSYYLSYGGSPTALRDELLSLETGCARGRGGSPSIQDPGIPMIGHSGLMGDQIPIAVGAALASKKPTLCVAGDAAIEEDYAFGAMAYAQTKKAPVLFVCEDNDLSILTPVSVRRSWRMNDVAASLGMQSIDIADDPWLIMHHVRALAKDLPAFINIRTCRHLWHAGAGCDGPPEWNRFELVQKQLDQLGLKAQRENLENEAAQAVSALWAGVLGQ